MVKVLITDRIDDEGVRRINEFAEVDVALGLKPPELLDRIKDYDVIVVRSATKVTKEVIDAGKKLKVIARAGAGLDNVDSDAAKERGIKVLNTPEAPSIAVAELAMGLMLAWARHIPRADAGMKQGKWLKSELMGTELRGKTLGIIGTGKIGREVGYRAKAFEMRILAYDVVRNDEFVRETGCEYVSLERLLSESDFVTVHIPLLPSTRHMIGRAQLELMKPTSVLVNTSRGEVVDEAALIDALKGGRIAGACLDVYSREPLVDSPLASMPNVVLTPHIGASTREAQREAALLIADKIRGAIS